MRFAEIEIREGGVYSLDFGDCYFSVPDGIQEASYVYLEANSVCERVRSSQNTLHIAEIGFGTGLNCALTLREYLNAGMSCPQIVYSSFEKFPIRKSDLERVVESLAAADEYLKDIWLDVIAQMPEFPEGQSVSARISVQLRQGFALDLYIGDAAKELRKLDTSVDIWYLDGFSPSIDTGLWTRDLFREITALSSDNTSLSSFTAAGWVRRELSDFGWKIQRYPGFGRKRHMICGQYKAQLC